MLPAQPTAGPSPSRRVRVLLLLVASSIAYGMAIAQQQPRVPIDTPLPLAHVLPAADAGPLPSASRLNLTLTLTPSPDRTAALDAFLEDVEEPTSPRYHQWITPTNFAALYGATPAQLAFVTAWAQSEGLTLDSIAPSSTRITVSGYTPAIEAAFAVSLHQYRVEGHLAYSPLESASLPSAIAAALSSVDGLAATPDEVPPQSFAALAAAVDANHATILRLTTCAPYESLAQQTLLFRQANAQGITVLSPRACAASYLAEATSFVDATGTTTPPEATATLLIARPLWQAAPGLPDNPYRQTPDLTVPGAAAFEALLHTIAGPGGRLGNINAILYRLGPIPGLYTQQDPVPRGTWEPATGLGLVDLDRLLAVFPRGVGSSFVSFAASTYTPSYGSPVTFTSTVTSGTGGNTPSGTVAYVTGTGATLGTGNVDASGNATYTTAATQLDGGTYSITVHYAGDATYAPATSSPAATLIVQPEDVALAGSVSSTNTVGGTYTVTITATAANGAGQPAGNVTLNISGTSTSYTQPFTPLGAHTASATFIEPATTVGTLTLAANCAGTASFTCPNAYTGNVTIAKATPTLVLSYTPDSPVSGATITLTALLGAHGTAALPTGTVTFYDNGIGLNAASIDNTGKATVTGITPTASTHSITAVYNGDPSYNTVTITGASTGKTPTSTSLAASSYAIAPGQPVTLTATLSNTAATGTVSFAAATQGVLAASVPIVNRVATFTSTTLPAGTYALSATYSGDADYAASSGVAPAPLVVSSATSSLIATTTSLAISPTTPQNGLPTALTATVTSASVGAAPVSGTVSFLNGTTVIGTGNISAGAGSSATATATATFSGATPLSLTAVYAGDTLYATSSSPQLLITPALTPASISLTANPSDGVAGSNVTLTATVAATLAGSIAPTGSVSFYLAGTAPRLLATAALTPQGSAGATATLLTGAIPAGPQTLYAVYTGDATFLAVTSASINIGLVDYGVSFSPALLTLSAGSTGTSVLTITPVGAFSATIALSCLPPPGSLITCSLSQSTLPGTGTATLTVITTAASTRSAQAFAGLTPVGVTALASLLCLLVPRRNRRRLPTLLLAIVSVAVLSIAGCATEVSPAGSNPGTPLGTVNLTINTAATTGATAVHHDVSFQVTVQ